IAYGRFNQAAELLLNTLDETPERKDLRLKLMEVFAEQGDRAGFQQQEAELRELGGAEAEIRQLKARYPDVAQAPVAAGTLAAGAAAGASALALESASADDLDALSFDSEAPSAAEEADFDKPLSGFDSLDFDLQLDTEPSLGDLQVEAPATTDAASWDSADLEFSLDEKDPFASLESVEN